MKRATSISTARRVVNDSYNQFNRELPGMNSKLFGKSKNQMDKAYAKRLNELMNISMAKMAKSTTSPSGKYKVEMLLSNIESKPFISLTSRENPNEVTIFNYFDDTN